MLSNFITFKLPGFQFMAIVLYFRSMDLNTFLKALQKTPHFCAQVCFVFYVIAVHPVIRAANTRFLFAIRSDARPNIRLPGHQASPPLLLSDVGVNAGKMEERLKLKMEGESTNTMFY